MPSLLEGDPLTHASLVASDSRYPKASLSVRTFAVARCVDAWPSSLRDLLAAIDSQVHTVSCVHRFCPRRATPTP